MLYQNIPSNIGKAEIETERSATEGLLSYLDERLPAFPAFFKKKTLTEQITAEVKISRELCLFLNDIGNPNKILLFYFYTEWGNDYSRHSSDFDVIDTKTYADNDDKPTKSFFVIEAKRLPTDFEDKGREKEYVKGKGGGIERYKRGHHGRNLDESAIIGYIQDEQNCTHWQQKINNWIKELISNNKETGTDIDWNSDDYLTQASNFKTTQKYTSNNTRIVNSVPDSIRLYHYLIELS